MLFLLLFSFNLILNFSRTKDARFEDTLDLYIQIVLKQGQIEVESQPADLPPNQYRNTDVELINRREVEDLNKSIIVKKPNILFVLSYFHLGISKFKNSSNGKI